MPIDKPSVVETAKQVAYATQQAEQALSATPGVPQKAVIIHVLTGVGIASGILVTALTLGTVPAIVGGIGAVSAYIAGWINPSPAAVSSFGTAAK